MAGDFVDILPQDELNQQQQDINIAFNRKMMALEDALEVLNIKITVLEERLKALEGDGK